MKEIPLSRGLVAFVDDDDYEYLARFKWHACAAGYVKRTICHPDRPGKTIKIRMHRVIAGLPPGDKRVVDHIDGNKRNNQRSNLRICEHRENDRNRGRLITNTSGFKGVTYLKSKNKWMAQIKFNKKNINLGYFLSPEEAHKSYCKAANELHGEFANHG